MTMETLQKDKLKVWRVRAGLNQKQLAQKAGVSERTIINYESDVNNLRKAEYRTIEKLADVLGIVVDNIFLG